MLKVANEVIQAFPITKRTYVGTPSGYTDGGVILHVVADCTVDFDFGTTGIVSVNAVAGQDLAFNDDVKSITATGECWIS